MFHDDENLPFSRRQRWILTALIFAMALLGSADVIDDFADGEGFGHVAIEVLGIVIGIAGIVWIWMQNQRLEATGKILRGRLDLATAEAVEWRARSQGLAQGLSQAIDDQFKVWHLSTAEKEVALLLLKGLSLKEVSIVRQTGERTSRQQAQEIYRKSSLAGRAEFAAFFLEDLLVVPDKSGKILPQ